MQGLRKGAGNNKKKREKVVKAKKRQDIEGERKGVEFERGLKRAGAKKRGSEAAGDGRGRTKVSAEGGGGGAGINERFSPQHLRTLRTTQQTPIHRQEINI